MTDSDGDPPDQSDPERVPDPDPIAAAEQTAAALSNDRSPRGTLGPRFDRHSPFFTGMTAAAGALTTVFVVGGAALIALVAAAIPPLTEQASALIAAAPHYFEQLTEPSSWLGRLNARFDLQHRLTQFWGGAGTSVLGDIVTAGQAVFTALTDTLIVTVLTVYFLADLPRLRATLYRFVPHSRRPRAILLGDEIFAKVGSYVLGNILISLIAGIAVAAVALTVSAPVCVTTIVFFIAFRLGEDYLLISKIIGRSVEVPALSTLIAVLIGGALLGLVGALVAIPFAAAVHLIAQEVLFPRLDRG